LALLAPPSIVGFVNSNISEVDSSDDPGLRCLSISCIVVAEGGACPKTGESCKRWPPFAEINDLFSVLPLDKNEWKSGLYVAIAAAMIATPISTVDQMARSKVS
jgi:hypothetical protein